MQLYGIKKVKAVNVTLFWLTTKCSVSLSVPFYRTLRNDKEDRFFYSDFISYRGGTHMRVDLDWWINIRSRIDGNSNTEYGVNRDSLYQFIQAIKTMYDWIANPQKDKELFYYDKAGKLKYDTSCEGVLIMNNFNQSLRLLPSVQDDGSNAEMGVLMTINEVSELAAFIPVSRFFNFVYMIEHLDIYSMGMHLINFANIRTNNMQQIEDTETVTQQNQMKFTENHTFFDAVSAQERKKDA